MKGRMGSHVVRLGLRRVCGVSETIWRVFFFFWIVGIYCLLERTAPVRGEFTQTITDVGLSLHRQRTWQAGQTTEYVQMVRCILSSRHDPCEPYHAIAPVWLRATQARAKTPKANRLPGLCHNMQSKLVVGGW